MTPVGLPPRTSIDWAMRKINTKQMEAMNRIKRETTRKKTRKEEGVGYSLKEWREKGQRRRDGDRMAYIKVKWKEERWKETDARPCCHASVHSVERPQN